MLTLWFAILKYRLIWQYDKVQDFFARLDQVTNLIRLLSSYLYSISTHRQQHNQYHSQSSLYIGLNVFPSACPCCNNAAVYGVTHKAVRYKRFVSVCMTCTQTIVVWWYFWCEYLCALEYPLLVEIKTAIIIWYNN